MAGETEEEATNKEKRQKTRKTGPVTGSLDLSQKHNQGGFIAPQKSEII